jgi:hypothetical protein
VQIVGDASSLQRALGQATSGTSKFGSSLMTLGKVAAVGFGAVAAGSVFAGKKMVDMASDAAEVDSKMKVIFGNVLARCSRRCSGRSKRQRACRSSS